MNTNIETIPEHKIAYIRRTGAYGSENIKIMEQLKNWARERNLLDENSIILGIAQDNPEITESKDCRYDVCLIISNEFKINNNYINFGKIVGGKYCVFKINHNAEAMKTAWLEIFPKLTKRAYVFDSKRSIIERYAMPMLREHYCEICVPIL